MLWPLIAKRSPATCSISARRELPPSMSRDFETLRRNFLLIMLKYLFWSKNFSTSSIRGIHTYCYHSLINLSRSSHTSTKYEFRQYLCPVVEGSSKTYRAGAGQRYSGKRQHPARLTHMRKCQLTSRDLPEHQARVCPWSGLMETAGGLWRQDPAEVLSLSPLLSSLCASCTHGGNK